MVPGGHDYTPPRFINAMIFNACTTRHETRFYPFSLLSLLSTIPILNARHQSANGNEKDEKLLQGHWWPCYLIYHKIFAIGIQRQQNEKKGKKKNYWRCNIAVFLNNYSPSGMRRIRWFASTPQGVGYLFLSLYYFLVFCSSPPRLSLFDESGRVYYVIMLLTYSRYVRVFSFSLVSKHVTHALTLSI